MRLFIKRLSLFILFGLLSFFIFFISINSFLNTKADFKLDSNVKSLILGHSHPERAYNDTLIPFTKNLSGAAESYLYTLAKTSQLRSMLLVHTERTFQVGQTWDRTPLSRSG